MQEVYKALAVNLLTVRTANSGCKWSVVEDCAGQFNSA